MIFFAQTCCVHVILECCTSFIYNKDFSMCRRRFSCQTTRKSAPSHAEFQSVSVIQFCNSCIVVSPALFFFFFMILLAISGRIYCISL